MARKSVWLKRDYYGSSPTGELYVYIDDDGRVEAHGNTIGYVLRGTRTYSPPTHKGSRIVKYHKQVPEWHGWSTKPAGQYARPEIRADTRTEILHRLLSSAGQEA